MNLGHLLDRRIPLALIAALMMQAATAVWWAASQDSDDKFEKERMTRLEQADTQSREAQELMLERLARIEERVSAEASALDRIEKNLGTERR